MDKLLSLIPENFYDIIARFIPSVVLLFGVWLTVPYEKLSGLLPAHGNSPAPFPKVLLVPLLFVVTWVVGYLVSVTSVLIEAAFLYGYNPMSELLKNAPNVESKHVKFSGAIRKIELFFGFPITVFTEKVFFNRQFPNCAAEKIVEKVKTALGMSCSLVYIPAIPFFAWFDCARKSPVGNSVVKSLAEATCARSLIVAFLVPCVFAILFHQNTLAWTFGAGMWVSFAAFFYYRRQARERLLLAILL